MRPIRKFCTIIFAMILNSQESSIHIHHIEFFHSIEQFLHFQDYWCIECHSSGSNIVFHSPKWFLDIDSWIHGKNWGGFRKPWINAFVSLGNICHILKDYFELSLVTFDYFFKIFMDVNKSLEGWPDLNLRHKLWLLIF